jgi:hypothetical protein
MAVQTAISTGTVKIPFILQKHLQPKVLNLQTEISWACFWNKVDEVWLQLPVTQDLHWCRYSSWLTTNSNLLRSSYGAHAPANIVRNFDKTCLQTVRRSCLRTVGKQSTKTKVSEVGSPSVFRRRTWRYKVLFETLKTLHSAQPLLVCCVSYDYQNNRCLSG